MFCHETSTYGSKSKLNFHERQTGDSGFVFVNFKERGKPGRRVSTKIKITRAQFDKYRNSDLPMFNHTSDKKFDSYALNKKIQEITSGTGEVKKKDDFIVFFENNLLELDSGATYEVYSNTLANLKKYYTEIPFTTINDSFMLDFKSKLIKENLSDGQVKYNIDNFKNYINRAVEDLDIPISINIAKLKLKKSHRGKDNLLDDADVVKMIDFTFDWEDPTAKKKGVCIH